MPLKKTTYYSVNRQHNKWVIRTLGELSVATHKYDNSPVNYKVFQ